MREQGDGQGRENLLRPCCAPDATRLRDVIKAIGDMIDSDCEPN
jgi:hypothetical protein